jgi:type I restriction enzyme S subunit
MKKGWISKPLGEVCKTGSGGTPLSSRKEYYEGGNIPWLVSGEVAQGNVREAKNFITKAGLENSAAKLFPKNTVLVAMYGATAGQVGILRFEAATNQAICGILPNDKFVPEFLFYFLLANKDELVAQATGNAQPNISQIKIKNTEVPLPPLAEQQRIVGILDETFAGLATAKANAEKNLQNARALFESHLQSVFSQRGEGWAETTLENHVDLVAGFAFKSSQYTDAEDDIRLIRGDNIVQGEFRWEGVKRWPKENAEEYSKFAFAENDVVLAMDRPWVAAGLKVAFVTKDDLPLLQVQRTARLRTMKTLHWRYLFHLIRSSTFIQYLLEGQTGLGVPHISGKQILSFEFTLPPIGSQKSIVDNLDTLQEETQRLAIIYKRKLAALEALKKSLLHQAFSGEL